MAIDLNQMAAALRSHKTVIETLQQQLAALTQAFNAQQSRPRSIQEEIDAVSGRRMESTLSGEVTFTLSDVGRRAAPVIMTLSQDGPFVMTHYPLVLWRPTAPDNTPNLNRWRPVTTFPLPDQVVDTDIIDILYELNDGGSQRFMQNQPRAPLLSRPDNIVPCPIPTLWASNSTIVFQPTYLDMTWDSNPAPTQGTLHVDLIGYRIINL